MSTDLERVTQDGLYLRNIYNQTEELCLNAVRRNSIALAYVKNQTDDICLEACEHHLHTFLLVRKPTPDLCLRAVKQNGLILKYIKEELQTLEICLEAVKRSPLALQYVKKQTPEVCLEAVKNNPSVLQYVNEQTHEMCIEAVQKDYYAINYIKNITDEILIKTFKHCNFLFLLLRDSISNNVLLTEAIKQNPLYIIYFSNPSVELYVDAIKTNAKVCSYLTITNFNKIAIHQLISYCIGLKQMSLPSYILMDIIDTVLMQHNVTHFCKINRVIQLNEQKN